MAVAVLPASAAAALQLSAEPVDEVIQTVDEVVETVTQPAPAPVETVTETLNETLDDAVAAPAVVPGTRADEPDGATPAGATPARAAGAPRDDRATGRGRPAGGSTPAARAAEPAATAAPTAAAAGAAAAPTRPGTDRLREAVTAAARGVEPYTFPLAIALAVALFLVVQGRLDARDPKLHLAPQDDRELTFR